MKFEILIIQMHFIAYCCTINKILFFLIKRNVSFFNFDVL